MITFCQCFYVCSVCRFCMFSFYHKLCLASVETFKKYVRVCTQRFADDSVRAILANHKGSIKPARIASLNNLQCKQKRGGTAKCI